MSKQNRQKSIFQSSCVRKNSSTGNASFVGLKSAFFMFQSSFRSIAHRFISFKKSASSGGTKQYPDMLKSLPEEQLTCCTKCNALQEGINNDYPYRTELYYSLSSAGTHPSSLLGCYMAIFTKFICPKNMHIKPYLTMKNNSS